MSSKKLDVFRHRDFEELLTISFEFLKQNIFQFVKFALILALPFILLSAIFSFDLLISQQLNIFDLFNKLKLESLSINPIAGVANLFVLVLYVFIVSLMGSLTYAYIKIGKNDASTKKIKLTTLWNEGKTVLLWLLLFNSIVILLLASYLYFLGFLNVLITISYTQFIWGFTLLMFSFTFLISSTVISWGSLYILVFVFVLVPIFIFSFWLFIRFILLMLYSVPLKLEEPNLNFTQRLVKCYQLIEGEALKSWIFIHTLSLAMFFITYVFSMPVYGLIKKIILAEQSVMQSVAEIFFKCFSYGAVIMLAGLMHLTVSISFYSLYAKITKATKSKQQFTNEPLGYQIHENGA